MRRKTKQEYITMMRFEKERELALIMVQLNDEIRNAVTRCERERAKSDLRYFCKELRILQKEEPVSIPA